VGSRVEQFAHLVWSTHGRRDWITAEIEPHLHGIIQARSVQEHCSVIAIGGMADHVHVLAKVHPSVSLARLAGVLKATSSGAIRRSLLPGSAFAWQTGYGAFSVSPRHVGAVERYVSQQKDHHHQRQTDEAWEPEA
jgi:putative transposase